MGTRTVLSMHILFVDDTPEIRDLFWRSFGFLGHTVETAQSGQEALELIAQGTSRYDVIILNHHMPQMTGLEVVQELGRTKHWTPSPIILFTGDTSALLKREALELGVARMAYKPVIPTDLIAMAQEVVTRWKSAENQREVSRQSPGVTP